MDRCGESTMEEMVAVAEEDKSCAAEDGSKHLLPVGHDPHRDPTNKCMDRGTMMNNQAVVSGDSDDATKDQIVELVMVSAGGAEMASLDLVGETHSKCRTQAKLTEGKHGKGNMCEEGTVAMSEIAVTQIKKSRDKEEAEIDGLGFTPHTPKTPISQ